VSVEITVLFADLFGANTTAEALHAAVVRGDLRTQLLMKGLRELMTVNHVDATSIKAHSSLSPRLRHSSPFALLPQLSPQPQHSPPPRSPPHFSPPPPQHFPAPRSPPQHSLQMSARERTAHLVESNLDGEGPMARSRSPPTSTVAFASPIQVATHDDTYEHTDEQLRQLQHHSQHRHQQAAAVAIGERTDSVPVSPQLQVEHPPPSPTSSASSQGWGEGGDEQLPQAAKSSSAAAMSAFSMSTNTMFTPCATDDVTDQVAFGAALSAMHLVDRPMATLAEAAAAKRAAEHEGEGTGEDVDAVGERRASTPTTEEAGRVKLEAEDDVSRSKPPLRRNGGGSAGGDPSESGGGGAGGELRSVAQSGQLSRVQRVEDGGAQSAFPVSETTPMPEPAPRQQANGWSGLKARALTSDTRVVGASGSNGGGGSIGRPESEDMGNHRGSEGGELAPRQQQQQGYQQNRQHHQQQLASGGATTGESPQLQWNASPVYETTSTPEPPPQERGDGPPGYRFKAVGNMVRKAQALSALSRGAQSFKWGQSSQAQGAEDGGVQRSPSASFSMNTNSVFSPLTGVAHGEAHGADQGEGEWEEEVAASTSHGRVAAGFDGGGTDRSELELMDAMAMEGSHGGAVVASRTLTPSTASVGSHNPGPVDTSRWSGEPSGQFQLGVGGVAGESRYSEPYTLHPKP